MRVETGTNDDSPLILTVAVFPADRIRIPGGAFQTDAADGEPWRLFALAHDRTELTDLSARQPRLKADMIAAWTAWAYRVGAYPRPGGAALTPAQRLAFSPEG